MSWTGVGIWGFAATILLTTVMAGSQGLGLTRMSIPYLLGTMLVADRDRAKIVGVAVHLANGWLFAIVYAVAFEAWGAAGWWRGAAVGLVHAAFVVVVGLPFLPGLHPRMVGEGQGPTALRVLEPPGFLGLHYGIQTPIVIVVGHLVFGAVLGGFYRV